jgi:hypothetical protein
VAPTARIGTAVQFVSHLPPRTDDLWQPGQHLADLCQQERDTAERGKDDEGYFVPHHCVASVRCRARIVRLLCEALASFENGIRVRSRGF